jgi:hypothetical protein
MLYKMGGKTNTEKERDRDKETDITRMKRTTVSDLVAE